MGARGAVSPGVVEALAPFYLIDAVLAEDVAVSSGMRHVQARTCANVKRLQW